MMNVCKKEISLWGPTIFFILSIILREIRLLDYKESRGYFSTMLYLKSSKWISLFCELLFESYESKDLSKIHVLRILGVITRRWYPASRIVPSSEMYIAKLISQKLESRERNKTQVRAGCEFIISSPPLPPAPSRIMTFLRHVATRGHSGAHL